MPRRLPIFVLGIAIGAGLALVLAALLWPAPAPAPAPPTPTPADATFQVFVFDDKTGEPITAAITIRRETTDGTPIAPEGGKTYTAQNISVTVPVDGSVIWVLVEAPGYQDFELAFRPKKVGGYIGGPVRMKRLDALPTPDGSGA
jgi:hypothetical protein